MEDNKPVHRLGFDEMPDIMTPQQVQDLLQISQATFFRWVREGQMPGAIKIGDSWRIYKKLLKAHFEGSAQTAKEVTSQHKEKQNMVSKALQEHMQKNNIDYLKAPEANKLLNQWGLLRDSPTRPGKPLRDLLRAGKIAGQEQPGGANSTWYIRRVS